MWTNRAIDVFKAQTVHLLHVVQGDKHGLQRDTPGYTYNIGWSCMFGLLKMLSWAMSLPSMKPHQLFSWWMRLPICHPNHHSYYFHGWATPKEQDSCNWRLQFLPPKHKQWDSLNSTALNRLDSVITIFVRGTPLETHSKRWRVPGFFSSIGNDCWIATASFSCRCTVVPWGRWDFLWMCYVQKRRW